MIFNDLKASIAIYEENKRSENPHLSLPVTLSYCATRHDPMHPHYDSARRYGPKLSDESDAPTTHKAKKAQQRN